MAHANTGSPILSGFLGSGVPLIECVAAKPGIGGKGDSLSVSYRAGPTGWTRKHGNATAEVEAEKVARNVLITWASALPPADRVDRESRFVAGSLR